MDFPRYGRKILALKSGALERLGTDVAQMAVAPASIIKNSDVIDDEGTRLLLADEGDKLPLLTRELLQDLCTELIALEERIAVTDGRVKHLAEEDERCKRLVDIPGIGPVTATALIATVGDARCYRSARHMAASFGLTPHEHSSGGKQRLLGISNRGDRYLRWLLVQGARSIMRFASRRNDALSRWTSLLAIPRGVNIAAVALANKLARIAWALAR